MRPDRLLLALALLSAARPAVAEEPPPLASGRPPEWSVAAGYGFSVRLNGGRSDEHLFLFAPGVSLRLGPHFEYVVEGHVARAFTPEGYVIGLMPAGFRYYVGRGRLLPYVCVGAGFGWTDLERLDEIDRRFNFLLQGSLGVRGALDGGRAWSFEARLSHISNANTVLPNLGFNAVVFLAGFHL